MNFTTHYNTVVYENKVFWQKRADILAIRAKTVTL